MKTVGTLILAILVSVFFVVTSFAQIQNSKHDLSMGTGTALEQEICAYCHTPHNAVEYEVGNSYPLWSMVTVADSAGYTEYSSPTLDGAISDPLAGPSRLCMSCHDGTIAMDNAVDENPDRYMGAGSSANLGQDLSNDHPVGVVYESGDLELQPISAALGTGVISDYLYDGLVTCASCHDVHAGENRMFLLQANTDSALCLACHNK